MTGEWNRRICTAGIAAAIRGIRNLDEGVSKIATITIIVSEHLTIRCADNRLAVCALCRDYANLDTTSRSFEKLIEELRRDGAL